MGPNLRNMDGTTGYLLAVSISNQMKHATANDLIMHALLLERLRSMNGIHERTPGHFYYKKINVIHFHIDGNNIYADIGQIRVPVSYDNYEQIISLIKSYMRSK